VAKVRLDSLVTGKGIVDSREKARSLIMAGEVLVNGSRISKPGTMVGEDVSIHVSEKPPFVSRGGLKLAHALDHFGINVTGKIALDVGASTGGFTHCMIKQGARKVYALDVGYGQLDYRLRINPQVIVMENVNAHYPFSLPERVEIVTADVSFISLEKIIPNVTSVLEDEGILVVLFKPQFEAGKNQVGKGGVVRDPNVHASALGRFICWAIEYRLRIRGLIPSPILGASGNREFFLLLGM